MAYATYIAHLDRRIRHAVETPERIGVLAWSSETTATWNGDARYVRADLNENGHIDFVCRRTSEAFPYDRFADDLQAPDLETTAQKVAQFLTGDDVDD